MRTRIFGMALLLVTNDGICSRAYVSESTVAICMDVGLDPIVVLQAQKMVTAMFSRIGVQLKWYGYRRSCPVQHPKAIKIYLVDRVSPDDHPDVLAYSMPFQGVQINIFYERVQQRVRPGFVPGLLAHVIVHEVTHIIEGTDQHSGSGIMKARWSDEDYLQMMRSRLEFTEEDLQLIRSGLASRWK
jgi:hypothetical protein